MKPVMAHERIQILDIVRGMAILGILLVNMLFYSQSLQAIQFQIELWPEAWNKAASLFLELFIEGKFIAVFSFLFGYGMILFKERSKQKGRSFVPLYIRRLLALFIFGLIHGWFIWFGDILLHYALLGFILLCFHWCKPRTLLIWSVVLILLVPTLLLISGGEGAGGIILPPELEQLVHSWIERDQEIYGSGAYWTIHQQRMADWNASLANQLIFYPQLLGLFLLGAYFAKRGLLHDVSSYRSVWRRICIGAGATGLATLLLPILLELFIKEPSRLVDQLNIVRHLVGGPLVGLFYIAGLAVLVQKARAEGWLFRSLASVGRMAFTNYIMQSVVCTLIFYGYGLGWYGKVDILQGIGLGVVIFGCQVVFSRLWLRLFNLGPLEWIWRSLTYLKLSPLRKRESASNAT